MYLNKYIFYFFFLMKCVLLIVLVLLGGLSFQFKDEIKIQEPYHMTFQEFEELLKGLLEGLQLEQYIDQLIACIQPDFNRIETLIEEAIQDLEHVDIKHLNLIVDALKKLSEVIIIIFKDLVPCAKIIPEIEKIIEELAKENFLEIALRILMHGGKMLSDLKALPSDWKSQNYHQFGLDLGNLFYLILF